MSTTVPLWNTDRSETFEAAITSIKQTIASKCDILTGSLKGNLDARYVLEPQIPLDTWFAPPGNTLFGVYYPTPITLNNLRPIMDKYVSYVNIFFDNNSTEYAATFNSIITIEGFIKQKFGLEKMLATNDLARKHIPLWPQIRASNQEPIYSKMVTQCHQAVSIIDAHLTVNSRSKLAQNQELQTAIESHDIVRILHREIRTRYGN